MTDDDDGRTDARDADILREVGMDAEADDLDEHLGGSF